MEMDFLRFSSFFFIRIGAVPVRVEFERGRAGRGSNGPR